VSQPEIAKRSISLLFWRSTSFKIIEFGANREPVYDFLLVINSNLGPILHRYWDTATYWPKIANFAHSFLFTESVNMVAVPRLHEMKYSETQQRKFFELTKQSKTDCDVNSKFILDK